MTVHDWNKADPPRDKFDMLPFTKECVYALNEIISETNCKIVLSSDHRNDHLLKTLNDIFIFNGCSSGPIDITPNSRTYTADNLDEGRCDEILSWIFDSNVPVDRWVAVDDLDLSSLGDNFIGTQMGIHLVKDRIIQFFNV